MHWLEHKIPPPIVGASLAALMWAGARISPSVQIGASLRVTVALVFAATGFVVMLSGVVAFRRASTTVNPLKPEAATSLVIAGVFRYTRNPMYVGMTAVLIGWAVWLAAPLALLGPVIFVLFINRFQIVPEERVLAELFGPAFAEYRARVRRWL